MAMQEFSRSLPMLLYGALDAVMPQFRLIFKEFGLTEQQWRILRVLWEHDRTSFGALAEHTLISAPSLVGVVDRVIAMGLVEKRRSTKDRRVVYVSVTRKGRLLEDKVMSRVQAGYAALQSSIDASTWDSLLDGLEQIAAAKQISTDARRTVNE